MNKAIFKYFSIVLIITLLFSSVVSMVILSDQMLDNTEQDMLYAARLVDYEIDYDSNLSEQVDKLNELAYNDSTRLTVIDREGKVLADSDASTISENHRNRKEVKEALADGSGSATR